MKKRISLLLCVLVLLLFAQSACALTISAIHNVSLGSLNVKSLSGNISNLKGTGSPLGSQLPEPSVLEKELELDPPLSGGVIRKAAGTDITVTDENNHSVTDDVGFGVSIPMSKIAGEGTIVQNVQVFHQKGDQWERLNAALTTLSEPEFVPNRDADASTSPDASPSDSSDVDTTASPEPDPSAPSSSDAPGSTPSYDFNDYTVNAALPNSAPSSVRPGLNLAFLTQSCSPFVIVWDEVILYNDLPQTGDSSASMAWLALLAASCAALLVLRRRFRRA